MNVGDDESKVFIWELERVFGHSDNYTCAYINQTRNHKRRQRMLTETERRALLAQSIDVRMLSALTTFLGAFFIRKWGYKKSTGPLNHQFSPQWSTNSASRKGRILSWICHISQAGWKFFFQWDGFLSSKKHVWYNFPIKKFFDYFSTAPWILFNFFFSL